jgi:hypothetical protein
MLKEIDLPQTELEPYAAGLAKTFISRWDIHARQTNDGGYICVHKPLHISHIVAHLKGEITLGAYLLDQSNRARYIVLDADTDDQMKRLAVASVSLAERGIFSYLEASRRGGHLWLFFCRPILGKDARRFGHRLVDSYNLTNIELFPKQDQVKDGPGSLIRLPFGFHRKSGSRYGLLTPQLQPLAKSLPDQIHMLCTPETVPDGLFQAITKHESTRVEKPLSAKIEGLTEPLSKRIKDSVSVLDFVSRYVELSPNGRGYCPFHDDQHASFAVNAEGNYWSCFAGCGGGSLIDFWMKYQNCDFKTAIRELANMLLNET